MPFGASPTLSAAHVLLFHTGISRILHDSLRTCQDNRNNTR